MYEVALSRRANRYYRRVDEATARRLRLCFDELRRNPFASRNVRPVLGRPDTFRYRVGALRVIFSVDRDSMAVRVHIIGPRGDVY